MLLISISKILVTITLLSNILLLTITAAYDVDSLPHHDNHKKLLSSKLIRRIIRQTTATNGGGFDWNNNGISNPNAVRDSAADNDDVFIFDDDEILVNTRQQPPPPPSNLFPRTTTPASGLLRRTTVAVPGMGTPRTTCENACSTTPEYNPVCGDDNMTYFSRNRLLCAQRCGKNVQLRHLGSCPRG